MEQGLEVQTMPKAELVNIEDSAMSIESMVKQTAMIQGNVDRINEVRKWKGAINGT